VWVAAVVAVLHDVVPSSFLSLLSSLKEEEDDGHEEGLSSPPPPSSSSDYSVSEKDFLVGPMAVNSSSSLWRKAEWDVLLLVSSSLVVSSSWLLAVIPLEMVVMFLLLLLLADVVMMSFHWLYLPLLVLDFDRLLSQ
jgi:hypothetical protein